MKTADLRKLAEEQEIEGADTMERKDLIAALQPSADPALDVPEDGSEAPEGEEGVDLTKMTVVQLKAEAKARGVDIKELKVKNDIIDAIESGPVPGTPEAPAAPAKPERPPEAPEDGAIPEESKIVLDISAGSVAVGSKAATMKKKLAAQRKVMIMIPLEGGEKFGTTASVILNGYRLNILKQRYVAVPEQVARIIMKSQRQTMEAYDAPRREDGSPMKFEGDAPPELQ